MDARNTSPFHALPPAVVALAVVIGGLEIMFQAATAGFFGGQGGVGWRLAAIQDYGVFEEVAAFMWANRVFPPDQLIRLLTYPLIHAGFIHAAFVIVFILAIGNMVSRVFSPLAFMAVFIGSSIFGALGFLVILDSPFPLIGGYPGVYGLIGAFTFILWTDLGRQGANQYRAFGLIGALLAIQILFGLINGEFSNVVAELCGFVAGFLMSFVVSPGGWQRVMAKLRDR